MDIFELTTHPEIRAFIKKRNEIEERKKNAGYNLFTISSYNAYLENFHSDIIASLLNPNAHHYENTTFLFLFIKYLNTYFKTNIDSKHYLNAKVLREKGRIDIWIMDETSKHSFFIENKINGAFDRNRQIEDYYNYVRKGGYEIDTIVYLSKDGSQTATIDNTDIHKKVLNLAAFNNTFKDLYKGWLLPCREVCSNDDSRSFVHQYSKLISHLSNQNMDNNIKEDFYKFVNESNSFNAVVEIHELYSLIPVHRAEWFSNETQDHFPFLKKFKFQNNYYIFERYIDEKGSYKLDVFFNLDGSASVVMWNTAKAGDEGFNTVKDLLTTIGLIDFFNAPSKFNGLHCEFKLGDLYPTMLEIDKKVLELVKSVFIKLKSLQAS